MVSAWRLLACLATAALSEAHMVITYPGWRGDNLMTNGTAPNLNPNTIGIDYDANGTVSFPYGMQWMYPCGGMPLSTNRTKWPVNGGAVAFQPGWFPGHAFALIYINIGIQGPGDLNPPNMSHPVVPPFQIIGPNNTLYGGEVCVPQVGMPANLSLSVGDNITIQIIETAQHGAALYTCVDVTLADPSEVEPVTPQNCHNSTDIGFAKMFTTTSLTSAGTLSLPTPPTMISMLSTAILASIFAGSFWL